MRDHHNQTAPLPAGTGAAGIGASIDATANGEAIDCRGFHEVEFLVYVGAVTANADPTNYWELSVQQANEDPVTADQALAGDWAAVPLVNMIGNVADVGATTAGADFATAGLFATIDAAAEDELWYRVTIRQPKAYTRFRAVETATVGATMFNVVAIRATAHKIPSSLA